MQLPSKRIKPVVGGHRQPLAAKHKDMKHLLLVCLVLVSNAGSILGQGWSVKTIPINSKDYILYPQFHSSTYVMNLYDLNWVWKKKRNHIWSSDKFPLDGMYIQFFKEDSSRVSRIFQVQKNVLSGVYTEYYLNGEVRSRGLVEAGDKTGEWVYYYKDGSLKEKGSYRINGFGSGYSRSNQVGTWNEWYSNGQNKKICTYDTLGKRTGQWIEYHENGQESKRYNIYHEKLHGEYIEFVDHGQILIRHNYVHGEIIDTISVYYYPNGNKQAEGRQKGNFPVGEWLYYYQNGNLKCKGEYQEYQTSLCVGSILQRVTLYTEIGNWEFFYPNQNIMGKGNFKPMEKRTSRGPIQRSKKTGYWEFYHRNGALQASGRYIVNSLESKTVKREKKKFEEEPMTWINWNYFDKNGNELVDSDRTIEAQIEEIQKEINGLCR